jgi:hypothetical protein
VCLGYVKGQAENRDGVTDDFPPRANASKLRPGAPSIVLECATAVAGFRHVLACWHDAASGAAPQYIGVQYIGVPDIPSGSRNRHRTPNLS